MPCRQHVLSLFFVPAIAAFLHESPRAFHDRPRQRATTSTAVKEQKDTDTERASISYKETDASSKGLVSSLTRIVNLFDKKQVTSVAAKNDNPPPSTPEELLERIRDDYVVRNYLWTGQIDLAAFDRQCRFTDPTLTFEGTDQFVKNLDNLVPIVNALTDGSCKSDLLEIDLNREEGYVQSRWNMVGSLTGLPWKPKIDVIGRTKFWYKPVGPEGATDATTAKNGFQVYFYDEEWEIPAGKALLQLITPPGTIKNTNV